MPIEIDTTTFSDRSWSDVDQDEVKRRLVAEGDQVAIFEAYCYVPEGGDPTRWMGLHHELIGDQLVLNREAVYGLTRTLSGGAGGPALAPSTRSQGLVHLGTHYRQMEGETPEVIYAGMG